MWLWNGGVQPDTVFRGTDRANNVLTRESFHVLKYMQFNGPRCIGLAFTQPKEPKVSIMCLGELTVA